MQDLDGNGYMNSGWVGGCLMSLDAPQDELKLWGEPMS